MKTALLHLLYKFIPVVVLACLPLSAQDKPSGMVPPLPGEKPLDFTSHSDVPPHPLNAPVQDDIPPLDPPTVFIKPAPAEVMVGTSPASSVAPSAANNKPTAILPPRHSGKISPTARPEPFIVDDIPEISDSAPKINTLESTSTLDVMLPELEANIKPSASSQSKLPEDNLPDTISDEFKPTASVVTSISETKINHEASDDLDIAEEVSLEDLPDISVVNSKKNNSAKAANAVKMSAVIDTDKMDIEDLPELTPMVTAPNAGTPDMKNIVLESIGRKAADVTAETQEKSEDKNATIPDIPFIPSAGETQEKTGKTIPDIPDIATPVKVKTGKADLPVENMELPEME